MILCSECYIQKDGKTLLLYRNKKKNDINEGKWLGIGGKFDPGETPEECLLREVKEEVGVTLTEYTMRGMITFHSTESDEPYYIFVFTASAYEGEFIECNEGTLEWHDTASIYSLNLWEGDRLFWKWLREDYPFFSSCFYYDKDELTDWSVVFHERK